MITLVLWAPSALVAGLAWRLVPGVPARHPYDDPLLHFILSELLRAVPYVTVFGTLASLLAVMLQRGDGRVHLVLQAALLLGAVVPLGFGLWMAFAIPLPEDLGSPAPYRLLFCVPVVVGSLVSGAPALMAVSLLRSPAARAWLREG
jgi:hypothetical protein